MSLSSSSTAMQAVNQAVEERVATTELGFEVEVAAKLEARGIYDLTRLQERKPEIYKAACKCLMMGVSAGTTGDILGLDIRTVNQVMHKLEAEGAITPYKERVAAELRGVISLAIDGLLERAKDGKLSAIDIAVLIDKEQLLSGGATSRVEHTLAPQMEEAAQFLRSLSARAAAGMVIDAEELGQKGAGEVGVLREGVEVGQVGGQGLGSPLVEGLGSSKDGEVEL
jgi:hypothetical protein